MSKSTPISQLPSVKGQDDLMLDDDATVQEVLNQIAQSQDSNSSQQYQQQIQQQMQQQQMQQMQQQQAVQFMPQMPPQQMFNPQDILQPQQSPYKSQQLTNTISNYGKSKFDFSKDIKNIFVVIGICVIVQVLPIETLIYKYVSIENVPYSKVMIKGVFAGVLYFVFMKYMS
jgi:hypothetical protein